MKPSAPSSDLPYAGVLKKVFFALVIFCSPLIFFTDLTVNPFAAQNIILTVSAAFLFVLYAFCLLRGGGVELSLSRADSWFFLFILICVVSLIYNGFWGQGYAVLSEGYRRGLLLLTSVLFGFMLGKFTRPAREEDFDGAMPRAAFLLLWAALWLLFPAFKMQGFFDVYALLLWCAGIYICVGVLKDFSAKGFADIMIALSAVACLYGLLQNLGFEIFWSGQISQEFGQRAVSTFGNPNFLSSYVIMLMPLCALYFLQARKKSALFYYAFVLCAQSADLAVSMTRSSWLGISLGALILFSFADFRRVVFSNKIRTLALVLFCAAAFFLWPQGGGEASYKSAAAQRLGENKISALSLNAREGEINRSYHQRLMMWTCGLETVKSSPVLGGGWGSFQLNYAPCQGRLLQKYPQLESIRIQANAAHNEFIEVASQSGLAGLLVYLTFFAVSFFAFFKAFKNIPAHSRLFYGALFCGLCAMLADNMLNITMQTAVLGFSFWFLFSIFNGAAARRSVLKTAGRTSFLIFSGALVLFFVLLLGQVNILRGGVLELSALKEYARGNFAKSAAFARASVVKTGVRAEAYYTLLNSLLKTGDFASADTYAAAAQKRFPFYHEFYLQRAFAQNKLGGADTSAANLKRVLELYPSYSPAAEGYASLVAQNPFLQTEENISFIQNAAQRFYYNSLIKTAVADVLLQQKRFEEARAYISPFVEQDNFNSDYIKVLKTADEGLGIKQDALLKKAENFAKLKTDLAGNAFNPQELEAKLKKLVQADAQDINAAMLLGELYYKTGRPALALETIEPFYRTHKKDPALNFALASANQALGRGEQADEYLRAILKEDSFNVVARNRLEQH